jgi:hypothetical protein
MRTCSSRNTSSSVLYATLFRYNHPQKTLSRAGLDAEGSFYHTSCSKLRNCTVVPFSQLGSNVDSGHLMLDIQLGIFVRTCSGSFVVPVGPGSFLCVSALKVSVFFAGFAAP